MAKVPRPLVGLVMAPLAGVMATLELMVPKSFVSWTPLVRLPELSTVKTPPEACGFPFPAASAPETLKAKLPARAAREKADEVWRAMVPLALELASKRITSPLELE